ncbi:MAG: hypothetical protein ACOYUZ_04100 [Patescibacteria group bacterium]
MNEPSQTKEVLRQAIKSISSHPPPAPSEQSGNYQFDLRPTKKELFQTFIPAVVLGGIAVSLILFLLAIQFHWI